MEKEEKAKVILDYDKYQELLERARLSDLKARSIEHAAYDKATKEYERCVNELREAIASLQRSNSNLRDNLSYLEDVNVSLRGNQIKDLCESRLEGYREFAWVNGDKILDKVMSSLDMSLKTIPALSFWNYFTDNADRVFCDKIRSCVGNSLNSAFLDFTNLK
jgi:exonuclease VII small subunit